MADATVGALRVTLGADTARFEEGLRGAEKSLSTFGKNITTIAAGIGLERIFEKSIEFVVHTFVEGFDRIDKVGKEAQKAGLGVETFSGLMLSAELADVSMNSLAASLGKLSKNMVDTSNGTGEAQKTFQALGISVTETDGSLKSSSQVLTEIAGKFEGSADGAGKTAAAMALLGRSGRELIPLLNEGAAGLAEMQKTAQDMGLVIDSNTSNAVQKFNDNLKILGKTKEGIANLVIAQVIPALVRLSDQFAAVAKNGGFIQTAAAFIVKEFQGLVVAVFETVAAFQGLGEAFGAIKEFFAATNMENAQAAWDKFAGVIGGFGERLRAARGEAMGLFTAITVTGKPAVDNLNTSTSKLGDTIAGLQLKAAVARGEFKLFATGFAEAAAQAGLTDKAAQGLSRTVEGLTPAQRRLNDAMLDFQGGKMLEAALTPAEQYEKKMQDINNVMREGKFTQEEYAKAASQAADSTGQSWTTVSKGIASNFSDALTTMAKDNKDFAIAAKAMAITLAIINTYEGATKALASVFWPVNLIAAGAVIAAGLAHVAYISSQHFAKGGSFRVGGGLTGVDSEMVSFRATPGEMVDIRRPGQGGGGGQAQTINLNMPRPNDFFSQHVREMVYALNKAAPNGYVLKVAQ